MRRVWRLVRWLVLTEIGIWRSLAFWLARRIPGRTATAEAFAYANQITPMLVAFTVVSGLELPVVHLLVPWESVRLGLLITGVWGLLWMLGLLASMRVYQHLVDDDGILVRSGARTRLRLPWSAIDDVRVIRASTASDKALRIEDGTADVPVLKQVRVEIVLREPLPLDGHELTRVRLYADNPKRFAASARARLPARR